MKIKITQSGWAGYTGDLGMVAFLDGVSVEDVSRADAAFLAGIVSIEAEDGSNPSMSQRIVNVYANEANVEHVVVKSSPIVHAHTKQSLEAIADASGIKGVREISDPLGIKANAIVELIEKILSAQTDAQNLADAEAKAAAAAQVEAASAPK